MIDFSLSDEQKAMQEAIRSFLRKECPVAYVRECDNTEHFPEELFQKLADLGWLGLGIPEDYGGQGGSCMDMVIFLEELAYAFESAANIYFTVICIAAEMIGKFGSEEQKKALLPGLAKGEIRFAFSISEPDSGSDAAALKTRAVLDGDHWVINGQKMFCSCAQEAHHILLMARTDSDAPKQDGLSMILVDTKTPGVKIQNVRKLGLKPMDLNQVFLTDVRVPKDRVIGAVNRGWHNALLNFNRERCLVGAVQVGAAQACRDLAVRYAKERQQFGRPISAFQLVQSKLVDMEVEVATSRLLVYRCAWMVDQGIESAKDSAIAKLFSGESYMRVAMNGMRVMAGWGYLMEYDMQRHYRDAKLGEIAPTPDIMRLVIAREILK